MHFYALFDLERPAMVVTQHEQNTTVNELYEKYVVNSSNEIIKLLMSNLVSNLLIILLTLKPYRISSLWAKMGGGAFACRPCPKILGTRHPVPWWIYAYMRFRVTSHVTQTSSVIFIIARNRACKLFNIRLYATLCFNYFRWHRRMFSYSSVFDLLIC